MRSERENHSVFENIPKRGRLLVDDGLESNKVDFKMDAVPAREPVEIIEYFFEVCFCPSKKSFSLLTCGGLHVDTVLEIIQFGESIW